MQLPFEFSESKYELIAGGWLTFFAIVLRLVAACPASCVVCTEDVTLCHQLSYTVAAPVTTKVLIITDGHLSSVESTNLSLLFNLALLSLSRNGIRDIQDDALHGLWKLKTLLLEHNHISSSSLSDHTFSKLQNLQVLVLSNNALLTLRGSWFRHTLALTRLQLDGNQITNLTDSSFGGTHLHRLRHLDLSNNFISYIGKDAFLPLPQLRVVDLSRNRLVHMPDVFTPLKQLILLSLDKNQWSCTCDLHPLARFLRNYTKSSDRTLRNAKDLNCQPSSTATAASKSVLRLSETNCDSKAPDLTERRTVLPEQDVALLTVLGFAGAVGLTCVGLVVFNWKLQQSKANEHISENLCCRNFDESLCACETRNYQAQGYRNCHLNQENEIKVMSIVESRKEMPLSQENSHQAALVSESTILDRSFKSLKEKDHRADSTFFCLGGRLLQSEFSESPENMAALNEANLLASYYPVRARRKLINHMPGEVQPQTLSQQVATIAGISSDTFNRRYTTSASALAKKGLKKHLTNESWQPSIEKGDNGLQPHRQRHFIMNSSPKFCESEGYSPQKILQKHRSNYDGPCGLLKWERSRYFQPNNSLLCKYVSYDQFKDYVKEKKPKKKEYLKAEKEQIQIKNAIEKFLTNGTMELSDSPRKIKKVHTTKKVSFQDREKNGLVMPPKTSMHWKQQKDRRKHLTNLSFQKYNKPQERNGGNWLTDLQISKRKRIKSDLKGKMKAHNLRVKLNLHPFRKVRVYPQESLPELSKIQNQVLLASNKLSKASEKEAKTNLLSSADPSQQLKSHSYTRHISKRSQLQHVPKQTPYYRKNTKRAPHFSDKALTLVKQSSMNGFYHSTVHIPVENSSILPVLSPIRVEHKQAHFQALTDQMQSARHTSLEVASNLAASWNNIDGILSPHHYRQASGQEATNSTEHTEQGESKMTEIDPSSLPQGNQIQLLGAHKIDTSKEYNSEQSHNFQHIVQDSGHFKHLGHGEVSLAKNLKIPHKIVENCIMDEGDDVEEKLKTKPYDSSHLCQSQSKEGTRLMRTNSVRYQKGTELSKHVSTSCIQAICHLANGSEKDINSTNTLLRDDGSHRLEIQITETEEKSMFSEGSAHSSVPAETTKATFEGTKKGKQQTWDDVNSEEQVLSDSIPAVATTTGKNTSTTTFHATENTLPSNAIYIQVNGDLQDLRDVQNIHQSDSSEDKDGVMTKGTHEALSLFPELHDSNAEAKNEVPLISRKIDETENLTPKSILYPLAAEHASTLPLEEEQIEQNNSNNNHFLL